MSTEKKKVTVWLTSVSGVLVIAAILIIINLMFKPVNVRLDCTEGKLYTLSDGTKNILKGLDKNISIRFYYSKDVADMPVPFKTYASRVEDMLNQYKRIGGKKIQVRKLNPTPDSDEEDSAKIDGIKGQSTNVMGGELIYLGLAVSCGGKSSVLPFLSPQKETLLEYDLSRAITEVTKDKKTKLGVMSSQKVMGGIDDPQMMMSGRGGMKPAWTIISELKRTFDVMEVPTTVTEIDDDINMLLVIHAKDLKPETMFALDQFVLRGGRLMAFVDPMNMIDMQNQKQQYMPPTPSNLNPLLKAWGIQYSDGKVVADRKLAFRRDHDVVPTVLNLTEAQFNADDPVTATLHSMLVFSAGAFSGEPIKGLEKTVMVKSSDDSELLDGYQTRRSGEDIMHDFKSDETEKELIIKLTGTFKTAYPDGNPADADKKADADTEKKDAKDTKDSSLKVSSVAGAVVLVADADMIYDAFCVQKQNFFGQTIVQPLNDNLNFVLNMTEYLTGDDALFSIRSRSTAVRPFERVQELQNEAKKRFQDKITRLEADVQKIQLDINNLQQKRKDGEKELLSSEQRDLLTKFKKKEGETKQELKSVRKQLRKDIDSLENNLMVINIAMMPLVVILFGIGVALIKRKRNVRK